MPLLLGPQGDSIAEQRARYKAYKQEIEAKRSRFPAAALEFALADWHYDPNDHRCPHDGWVETLTIVEPASGEHSDVRELEIRLVLLGAYHDGRIHLRYPGVRHYSLFQPREARQPAARRGHGDWLIDEISLSVNARKEHPLVVHEIVFANDAVWTIEAEDVVYRWEPHAE